jgi:hypothetical protein
VVPLAWHAQRSEQNAPAQRLGWAWWLDGFSSLVIQAQHRSTFPSFATVQRSASLRADAMIP